MVKHCLRVRHFKNVNIGDSQTQKESLLVSLDGGHLVL